MSNRKLYSFFPILFLAIMFLLPNISNAQISRTFGNTTEASSQLVFFYMQDNEGDTQIQVTNTNDTEGVWVHVQIFRSFDASFDPDDDDFNKVICDERNFVDFYTPNDTHFYDLNEDNFRKNIGETEADPGESSSIVDTDETLGFIVVTPVVSEADLSAISFHHLMGITRNDESDDDFRLNAVGRDAVDFSTGEKIADGTPLDGTSNGFVLIQPAELSFNFSVDNPSSSQVDVVGIVFSDVYGDTGLLGYQVMPGDSTWTSFIFDYKEDPTSCGNRQVGCFISVGLNDVLQQNNEELRPGPNLSGVAGEDLLCTGVQTPEYPVDLPDFEPEFFGWTRIFVSGVEGFENHIGAFINEDINGARWMYAND